MTMARHSFRAARTLKQSEEEAFPPERLEIETSGIRWV